MSNPILDPKLPFYLLERKLQHLQRPLEDENSGCGGGRRDREIEEADKELRVIRGSIWPDSVQGDIKKVLDDIQLLDVKMDRLLLGREKVSNIGYCSGSWNNRRLVRLPAALGDRRGEERDALRRCLRKGLVRPGAGDWDEDTINTVKKSIRDDVFNKLVAAVPRRNLVLILHGRIGGDSKATLMRALYERVDIIKDYPFRAWVSIHETLRYKDVLLQLIEQVVNKGVVIDHTKPEYKLVEDLFILLSGFTRYLIVLEDCTPEIWPKLMECFPETGGGSRVVITTANPIPIDNFMERPEPREADESISFVWVKSVGNDPDNSDSVLATAMTYYTSLHALVKACFLFLSIFPKGRKVPLRRVWYLWLSEGFLDVDDQTHVNLVRARNRLTPPPPPPPPATTTTQPPPPPPAQREVFWICFEILVMGKLVEVTEWKLDGSAKSCRIPIFLHDYAVTNLTSTGLFNVFNDSEDGAPRSPVQGSATRVLRLACLAECQIPSTSLDGYLRSYVSFHNKAGGRLNEDISVHLKTLTRKPSYLLLKLLDLEGVYKPKLPECIGVLLYLKFLGLRSTLLDSIPTSVAKLQCLETLDLKHTNIVNLPTALLRSKRLTHLHTRQVPLDDFITWPCRRHRLPFACPKRVQPSLNLQTLTGLHIGSVISMETGRHLFGQLRELEVTCEESLTDTDIQQFIDGMKTHLQALKLSSKNTADVFLLNFSGHEHLEKIYLCGRMTLQNGNDQLQVPAGLKELTLSKSGLETDPMPALGQLLSLEVLRLLGDSYNGAVMKCKGFPKLRVLKLWKLANLRHLILEEVESGPGLVLEDLEIRKCSKMETFQGSKFLPGSFKMLVLHEMPVRLRAFIKQQRIFQKTSIVPQEDEQ